MKLVEALVALHAAQTFLRLPLPADGRPYGPGYFYGRQWRPALSQENRRVSLRLARSSSCIACGGALTAQSTGDHIIPTSRGGPQGAQNYLPLCRSCNSSKSDTDLFTWWRQKGRLFIDLDRDVVCAYVRLRYQSSTSEQLEGEADSVVVEAVAELLSALPSSRHQDAVLACARRQS